MYLMACLAERAQGLRTAHAIRRARSTEAAHRLIAAALPPAAAAALGAEDLERVRRHVLESPEPATQPRIHRADWQGALGG